MRNHLLRAAALIGAAALILSGCSGDEGSSEQAGATEPTTCNADGVLNVGSLLPLTGSLSFLGPPQAAGAALAVAQINDAGGVLDTPVVAFDGDSGDTTTNIAVTTTDEFLKDGVDAVVGPSSAAVTETVIDRITAAGALEISPANTSISFSTRADRGLFFRTAPPDQFQGAVLADVAWQAGVTRPIVLARQDSYGESLASTFTSGFQARGGTPAAGTISYDPGEESFEGPVGQAVAASPDAVVLIGFDESAKIVLEMIKQGIGPDRVKLFLVDANLSNVLYTNLPAGVMNGTQGTLPGAAATETFRGQLLSVDPDLIDFAYAPETYDAVNLVAIAAQAAGSDCGPDIAAQMVAVSSGGTPCATFGECAELLKQGGDIDYNGQSGPIEFDANGDPSQAVMGVYLYGPDNKSVPQQFVGPLAVPPLP